MRNRSKAGLFLIEIIISLLFFALGAVVCIQMFLLSHNTTQHSKSLSSALAAAQTAAEIYEAGGTELLLKMTYAQHSSGAYHANFDQSGQYTAEGEYKAVFTEIQTGDFSLLGIEIFGDDELLFDMQTAKYSAQ